MEDDLIDHHGVPRRRGIYLLPNLFTTAGLFAGFYAIVAAMKGYFSTAALVIFIAMIADSLDGRVARLTNTESAFGAEYDSLSDLASFGIAPALVVYSWALADIGKLGWLAAFMYTAATALRLARFNTQTDEVPKAYFQGLPCPAAAGLLAGVVWFCAEMQVRGHDIAWLIAVITVLAAVLMVSNLRYHSFKQLDFKGKVPFVAILVVVMIFVLISVDPPAVLCTTFSLFVLSGPLFALLRWRRDSSSEDALDGLAEGHTGSVEEQSELKDD